jgi:SAM-dependent methyltransferase
MRSFLRDAALVALRIVNHGMRHQCPICQRRFGRFMRRGINLMCVGCRSYARHRLMMLYIQRETDLLRRPRRVLHIAPEPGLYSVLSAAPTVDYVTVDLEAGPHVQVQADARDLPFRDDSFDAIVCSHVLEHIPDDVTVAHEMARVLTRDGVALIQVPADPSLETTYETFAPTPADRAREYGQHDHVRIYPSDISNRLGQAFGTVDRVNYAGTFAPSERRRMGLVEPSRRPGEEIYVCCPAPPHPPAASRSRGLGR